MKFVRFLWRALAGIPLSILFMWPIAGGLQDAVTLIVLSIVCTAGIGLVIWIPIWWFIGWTAFTLTGLATGKTETGSDQPPAIPKISREHQAIINFMEIAYRTGTPKEQIVSQLQDAGWPAHLIEEAHQFMFER